MSLPKRLDDIFDNVEIKTKKQKKVEKTYLQKAIPSPFILHNNNNGSTKLYSKDGSPLYELERDDYTLISNAVFDPVNVPLSIKPLINDRWYFVAHPAQHNTELKVNESILRQRVKGGQNLAFTYVEISIQGVLYAYLGFIPTIYTNSDIKGSHRIRRISATDKWPRKLYVYLEQGFMCDCGVDNCVQWSCRLADYKTVDMYCSKKIPWEKLYIMMGDNNSSCNIKIPRLCVVCSQCIKCAANPIGYCSLHKECSHINRVLLENGTIVADSKIKICKTKH